MSSLSLVGFESAMNEQNGGLLRKKETKLNSAHSTHWKMREEKLEVLEGGPSFYDKKCVTRDRI